jgi:hypothetical protein
MQAAGRQRPARTQPFAFPDVPAVITRLELTDDPPVEGCECVPRIMIQPPDAHTPRFVNSDDDSVNCRWLRAEPSFLADSGARKVCAVPHCGKTAVLQCFICSKADRFIAASLFCSTECFASSWKTHQALHEEDEAKKKSRDAGVVYTEVARTRSPSPPPPAPCGDTPQKLCCDQERHRKMPPPRSDSRKCIWRRWQDERHRHM